MLQAIALIIMFPLAVFCWLRVINKAFRRKYRPWWLSLAGKEEEDAAKYDTLDTLIAWIAASVVTFIFVYIAGLGYFWK
jgi:hypothetical protein